MKRLLISMVAAMAVTTPVWAQGYYSGSSQPQQPAPAYGSTAPVNPAPAYANNPNGWQSLAITPRDAYREGLINRWQFEQIEGPLPQALQGPSPDGGKATDPGH